MASLDRVYNSHTDADPAIGMNKAVSASGMGIVVQGANDCDALHEMLVQGKDSLHVLEHLDLEGFLGKIGSAVPELTAAGALTEDDLEWMDRATAMTAIAFEQAIADSGIDLTQYDTSRIAVVIGSSHSGLIRTEEVARALITEEFFEWSDADHRKLASSMVSNTTAVIARLAGATGRAITVSSACASSNSAVGMGADLVRFGEADIAICGGCDTVSLSVLAGFNALRALSSEKTSPFSETIGLNVGEGAGIVLVEASDQIAARGQRARFDVLGYGLSGDAHHATAPDAEGRGAEAAMRAALRTAKVEIDNIDYINAHGTGTDSNDIAEASAYRRLFGKTVPISSLKSFFGHTLGASGIVELISSVVVAEKGQVPPNLRLHSIRDGCGGIDLIANTPRDCSVKKMVVNNYGFGGNNSSLCIGVNQDAANSDRSHEIFAIGISGIGAVSASGEDLAALANLVTVENGAVSVQPPKALGPKVARPNFRTPDLKKFARCPISTKLELLSIGQALGDKAQLFYENAESGLISGRFFGAQKPTEEFMKSVFSGDAALASAHHFPMTTMNASVGQCSIAYGIRGFVTAICGSASALSYALDLVKWGHQDRMIVGSGDETTNYLNEIYQSVGSLAEDTPFEGGAALAFSDHANLQANEQDCLANVTAWSILQDGVDIGPSPSGRALASAITATLSKSGKASDDVDLFIEVPGGSRASNLAAAKVKKSALMGCDSKTMNIAQLMGFLPSSGTVMAICLATALITVKPKVSSVMVFGSDLVGDSFAFMVEHT